MRLQMPLCGSLRLPECYRITHCNGDDERDGHREDKPGRDVDINKRFRVVGSERARIITRGTLFFPEPCLKAGERAVPAEGLAATAKTSPPPWSTITTGFILPTYAPPRRNRIQSN